MEQKVDGRKTIRNALIVLIMTGLIIYVIYHCLQYFKDPVQVTAAVRQSEMQTQEMTAYLFRDEQVLTSSAPGALQAMAEDGAHVSVGSEVARVYINEEGETLYRELRQLNEQIAFWELCLSAADMSYTQLPALNEKIAVAYENVMAANARGDGAKAAALSDELLLLLNQRQVMTGELSDLTARCNNLKLRRDMLEATYTGTYESIRLDRSGYYFRETDGYEHLFNNDALDSMTLEGFYDLISQPPQMRETSAGKVIDDYVWYAAIPSTLDACQMLLEGNVYRVTFEDGTALDMTLDRILMTEGDDRCVLIFETGHMPQGFSYRRIQRVTLEVGQTQGLRVPQIALMTGKDGEMGVYILDVAYVRYRRVDIIWHGDGYVLVSESDRSAEGHELDLGYQELIITRSDEELYDGKLLY